MRRAIKANLFLTWWLKVRSKGHLTDIVCRHTLSLDRPACKSFTYSQNPGAH